MSVASTVPLSSMSAERLAPDWPFWVNQASRKMKMSVALTPDAPSKLAGQQVVGLAGSVVSAEVVWAALVASAEAGSASACCR